MADRDLRCVALSSVKGTGAVNEDAAFCLGNFCWVLDGATPIRARGVGKYGTQAEWLAQEFQAALTTAIGDTDRTIEEILAAALAIVRERNPFAADFDAGDRPSMTMALMRVVGSRLEAYVIGDCSIHLLSRRGDVMRLTDRRVAKFSNRTLAVFKRHRGSPRLQDLLIRQRDRNKRRMNRWGGYWVVTPDASWLRHGRRFSLPARDFASALLCTDGFDRLFDVFDLMGPEAILRREVSVDRCQEDLRKIEGDDADRTRFPRLKVSDDSTAVLVAW